MFQSLFICIGAESRDERGSRSAITSILSVPQTRFEAEQQNSQTKRDYHRNYHCTAKLFLRELHCHGARVGFHNPSFEGKRLSLFSYPL